MKKLLTVLCILVLALCLTGTASAEDCQHENAENNGFSYENGAWQHIIDCPDCGLTSHTADPVYTSNGGDDHTVSCPECGLSWTEGHYANCGEGIWADCVYCDQLNAFISAHINHPEDVEAAWPDFGDSYTHTAYCKYCDDDLGEREHVLSCADYDFDNEYGTCIICGSQYVYGRLEHNSYLFDFDTVHCYYKCDCGEIYDELRHVVYCDSEDKNTCVACGQNVDADRIVISDTWHRDHIYHDDFECWDICDNCGELYHGTHYFNCDDNEQTNCASCGASTEEVDINRINHTGLENDSWWNGDVEYHRPYCDKCDWQVEDAHPFLREDESIGSLYHRTICTECDLSWLEGHGGNCGENDQDTTCIACGDENVHVSWHDNHRGATEIGVYIDITTHHAYCSVCHDDWGKREHVSVCGEDQSTCIYCDETSVNARIEHPLQLESTDEFECRAVCECGEEIWEGRHGVSCTRLGEEGLTCDRCGVEVAEGRYDIWHDYQHDSTHWDDVVNEEIHDLRCRNCGAEKHHSFHPYYEELSHEEHRIVCDECGQGWSESHWGFCGENDENGSCVYCNAVGVQIGPHVDHLGLTYAPIDGNRDEHSVSCDVCSHAWTESHTVVCSADPDAKSDCQVCGASDVNGEVIHNRIILASNEDSCMVTCDCGVINEEGNHGHDCRAGERGETTCDRCGQEISGQLEVWHDFGHYDIRWNDEMQCDEHILRCRNCGYEKEFGHPYNKTEFPNNEQQHYARCDECGITWLEDHVAECGSEDNTTCAECGAVVNYPLTSHTNHPDGSGTAVKIDREQHQWSCGICGDIWNQDVHVGRCGETENIDGEWIGTCIYCGAENVHIGYHEGHPDNAETYVNEDDECHRAYCSICEDDLGVRLHSSDCSAPDRCADCGVEGVICANSDHVLHLVDFDENCCYYSCACGEEKNKVWHGVYCDSEDKNTCAECSKNVEEDGIIISDTWHDTVCGSDEQFCWTVCPACGIMPYYAEHYTGCTDWDDTRCDNCGRSEESGIQLVWKHTNLGHDTWEEDGIEWHRQFCGDCGCYEGEAHAADVTYTAVDGNPNEHRVSCRGCEFYWTASHYAVCGEEKCADCGAENVTFAYHIDHPDNSGHYVYKDADSHKKYCGICGDDWGWEEHVADCSDFDSDSMTGTCLYCGAENVNVIDVEHNTQLVGFDEEHCYYNCACGEDEYNWQHVVYCDSAQGICVGCGKSVEADGIVISITWHRDHTEHNESECWDICDNCGELYHGVHYFSCADEEQMYCDHCNAPADEVVIDNIRHTDIDFNDSGDGWHDPWCLNCGEHLSEPHEFSLYFKNGGYEQCHVYCDTCGYLTDWGHLGQCGESYEHTYCLRCDAQDIHVFSHDNHVGPEMARSIDDEYHEFYCSTCDEEHYIDEHKAPVGSNETFGKCAVCGAENVNLHGPVTEEERIEDGIRVFISYNEDGTKHIDYSDAETGEYYGWENYENWLDEQPTDWDRRSNVVYDEENDIYSYSFDASWGNGVKTHRISSDRTIYQAGFDGELFFEDTLNEDECIWYCTHWEDPGHTRILRTVKCTEEDSEWIYEQNYEYDVRDVPGSMLVHIHEYGEEVAQEFYTSANDTEPSQWEQYSNIGYETDDNGCVYIHRDFVTSEGDHGTMYFRIDGYDWFFIYENRYMGDGIGRMETNWNESEQVYCQTTYENDRPVFTIRSTSQWEIISTTTWEYFSSIGPVVKEHEQRDNGNTVYEKVYTNPNDKTTYEEHTFVDENGYTWRAFTVHGVTRVAGKSILNLPENIRKIESEAFVGVPGWIVILHEGVTSIASDAFSPDTVLLVPNEKIAKLAQNAGYVWFFE